MSNVRNILLATVIRIPETVSLAILISYLFSNALRLSWYFVFVAMGGVFFVTIAVSFVRDMFNPITGLDFDGGETSFFHYIWRKKYVTFIWAFVLSFVFYLPVLLQVTAFGFSWGNKHVIYALCLITAFFHEISSLIIYWVIRRNVAPLA